MKSISFLLLALFVISSFHRAAAQAPLQVVVSSPRGETRSGDQVQTIFVTFNQPMVPLTAVSQQEGASVMQVQPPLAGKYRWMGTTTLAFIPEKPFPNATLFTVKIPAGTASLSGQRLGQDYQWTFVTPRPHVVRTMPQNGQKFIELDHSIALLFDQKVDPQSVARFVSIRQEVWSAVGTQTSYPGFTASRPDAKTFHGDSTHAVLLVPTQPFMKSAAITVTCKAGLRGVEGDLGMASDFTLSFTTFNDLSFNGVTSDYGFDPGAPLRFNFSNPVSAAELAGHIWLDPAVKLDGDYGTWTTTEVYLSLPLKPETAYRGVVKAGLKDRYGNMLPADLPFTFTTSSFRPYVHMTTGQGILEAYESHNYPVTFMNTGRVGVQMGKVNPDRIVEVMQQIDYSYSERMAFREGVLLQPESMSADAKAFTRSTIWNIRAARNVKTVKPLDLDAVLGASRTGVVFAQVNTMDAQDARYLKALVQVTHMGITAKFSPESGLIWVTNLIDATPVPGASVEIRDDSNKVVWTGKTDASGLAAAPGWGKLPMSTLPADEGEGSEESEYYDGGRQPRQWVIVRNGDDIAFSSSDWNEGIQPWNFGVQSDWNPQPEKVEGVLFTDRGLYKAGEKVELKGIVRARRGGSWNIARNIKLQLTVKNSRNEELLSVKPTLSPFGSFALTVPLKPSAPLGEYSMSLAMQTSQKGKARWKPFAWQGFRVEAFRPAEFEVTAATERKEYIVGDTVTGFINARYLFGAPLKNEPLDWRASKTSTDWRAPGYQDYFFGPLGWLTRYGSSPGYGLLTQNKGRLNEQGGTTVRFPLTVGEIRGTSSVMLEADVTSPSRQNLAGRTTVLVHGGEFAIGIKPKTTFLSVDSPLDFLLVAVTPDGAIALPQSITVKVIQRVWNSVRKAETGGRYSWVSEEVDSLRDSVQVMTGTSPTALSFTPGHAGFYYLEARGKDRRGNELVSQAYFYVSGSGYVAWERSNDDRIELVADKQRYAPGEVAHVMVKSPYESASALVSLEREGIIRHYTTKLVGSAPSIDVPITSDLLPNVFVSVVLLQGRTARPSATTEGDVGRPSFKIGYAGLSVSPKERELKVTVKPLQADYRPGDTVGVDLQVHDAAGNGVKAEVALSVADLGVLNLINYRMPNPFNEFYRERPLGVTTTETRLHLVEQREYGEKGEDEGGGGAAARAESDVDAEGVRKDFRASAYWNPSIMTDSTGSAAVRFRLPDNLTSFEAMAVAHSKESQFGYGDCSFTVSKVIVLQPSLPRFARVGDSFESGVVIVNHSGKERDVTLTASAKGIRMLGNESTVQTLKAGESREVRYSFKAEQIGIAVLTFRARSEEDGDGLQWTIPVTVPRLRESVVTLGSTTDEHAEEAVMVPDSTYRELDEVEATAASTAMVGLSGGISYLFNYPYGCIEQRCSAILPIILAKDLVEAFHFEVLQGKDERQVVTKTLDELPLFQRSNGGFAYWKNTTETWAYPSAYAMYTLIQARRNGYRVDEQALKKGLEYLRMVLNGQEIPRDYSVEAAYCTRALILYTLALGGMPDHAYMATLYSQRQQAPLFARAYLLRALHQSNANKGMQDELARELANMAKAASASVHFEEPRENGLDWVYHSTARTTALVMQSLIETQPENALIPRTVRWLLDQQKVGCWRTTQENIYVVDALAAYFKAYEKEEPDFRAAIALEGKNLLSELFSGRSMKTASGRMSLAELAPSRRYPVSITKAGPGRLYYGVRMNYYPRGNTPAKEEGLVVSKTIEVNGALHDPAKEFEPGTVAKITLTVVTNQDRHFIVLNDPLPAGFEIINESFSTTASNVGASASGSDAEAGEDEEAESSQEHMTWTFGHIERYDDHILAFADDMPAGLHTFTYMARVTRTGKYNTPSTRVEGMYEPEVFGQTGAGWVTVR